MDKRYKLIISNKRIFKEVELPVDADEVRIGTTKYCSVRFGREQFFSDIELSVQQEGQGWLIRCPENLYFTTDGVMKLYSKELVHGDDCFVKYQDSNQEVFKISFMLNFDCEKKDYNRVIDIGDYNEITIGGDSSCDLVLKDELIGTDTVTLKRAGDHYVITDNNTKYGTFVNGQKVKGSAELKDYDFFSIISYSFYLKFGKLYTSSKSNLVINGLNYIELKDQESNLLYPKFNRSTRLRAVLPEEKIEVLDPPSVPELPKRNIVMQLLPALAMIALTVVLRGMIGGGGTFVIFSAGMMSIGIITSVATIVMERQNYKAKTQERIENYTEYIEAKRKEIEKLRNIELSVLNEIYYSVDQGIDYIRQFSGALFDRSFGDPDFLHVRLGEGAVLAKRQISYKAQERLETTDELMSMPETLAREYKYLQGAPVISDFARSNAVGVVGQDYQLYDLVKNMTLDICIRHYHNDVKLSFIVKEDYSYDIKWVRWFQHVVTEEPQMRNIACDAETKNMLYEYLYVELSNREKAGIKAPHMVVFVLNDSGIKSHPISKYIGNASKHGFTFVFFENSRELLPQGCDEIIMLNPGQDTGYITYSEDKNRQLDFSYKVTDDSVASYAALRLAPVYCEEVSLESTLTKNISLFELLDILSVEDLDLTSRWNSSQVYKSLAAPIGVKTKGQIVYLDLHEKAHGPHGLVAGTTGSGKSETLQTYVLSMASLFHPYEVSFVIIDFKGGGMVNQFKSLPHLVGSITNIDGREIQRSLLSIKAELQKRQRLFAENNVNHIDTYIRKFKAGEVEQPLPHLVLIVDEFAELKAEQPEFMKELISAARIGRSLGVHLILATQKPSGQVDEQIWSNSRFRLCLKVQTKEDSNEVIKSPLAAEIKEPGRTYLQVGNNEIFELFQSAYSGSSAEIDDNGRTKEFQISEVTLSGKRNVVFQQKRDKGPSSEKTQLTAVVDHINEYCTENRIERLPSICLPALPDSLQFEVLAVPKRPAALEIAIGTYDDPGNQYQGPAVINIAAENLLIIGSAQYGKTNFIQSIIRSVATNYGPDAANFYLLDFGSMVLKNFEDLKHVGGVVIPTEDERLKNLFKMLISEVTARKNKLLAVGVSSFASYKEAGYTDMPYIILIVDNFTVFRELYYDKHEEEFIFLCREGLATGISVIVSSPQTSGLGYKYLSNFGNRIAFTCNDKSEYGVLFDRCRIEPKNTPGRALINFDKTLYELQTYISFEGDKEIERAKAMKEFINATNRQYKDLPGAKKIPGIPELLSMDYIHKHYQCPAGGTIPFALDYTTVDLVSLDTDTLFELALIGNDYPPKLDFLRLLAATLNKNLSAHPVKAYIIDGIERRLREMEDYPFVEKYTIDLNESIAVLEEVEQELAARYELLLQEGMEGIAQNPLLLIILNSRDTIEHISTTRDTMNLYTKIAKQYKGLKVMFIFADVEDAPVTYNSPELIKRLKEVRKALIFSEANDIRVYDLPITVTRPFAKPLAAGDAFYLMGNQFSKIKIALAEAIKA